jgi:hypothetical protein
MLLMIWKVVLSLVVSLVISSCTHTDKFNRRSFPKPEKNDGDRKPLPPTTGAGQGQFQEKTPEKPSETTGVEIIPMKRGEQEIKQGQWLYENKCSSCHPGVGKGQISKIHPECTQCTNIDFFVKYVPLYMPKNAIGSCDQQCAKLIGFYLFP